MNSVGLHNRVKHLMIINASLLVVTKSNQPRLVPFNRTIRMKFNSVNLFTTHKILARLRWYQLSSIISQ